VASDWDRRWRTGGTVAEVLEEAHLSPAWILRAITRFAQERPARLQRMRSRLQRLGGGPTDGDGPDGEAPACTS
jgi:hypothetical protein